MLYEKMSASDTITTNRSLCSDNTTVAFAKLRVE